MDEQRNLLELLWQHKLLVLGLVGATLAFLVALAEKTATRPRRRTVTVLVSLAFIALVIQQLLQFDHERDQALLEQNREKLRVELLHDIKHTGEETKGVVDRIASVLTGQPLSRFGSALLTVAQGSVAEEGLELLWHGKGRAQDWEKYAQWLESAAGVANGFPCLSLTLNAHHHYRVPLLLAYLFTGPATETAIRQAIESGWEGFPSPSFMQRVEARLPAIKCVLLFDRNPQTLIAYADAQRFAEELLVSQRMGESRKVEQLLNRNHADPADVLTRRFASVTRNVVATTDPGSIVRTMLDRSVPELIVASAEGSFLVRLNQMVDLAAEAE